MRRVGLFLVLTVLLWAVSGVGMAQDRPAPVNWDSALNAVTRQIGDPRMDDTGFAALRGELERLRVEATQERERRKQEIGRQHESTPVTHGLLLTRHLLEKKNKMI